MDAGRKLPHGKPAKDVVDGVDRLYRCGGILEGAGVDASFTNVHQLANAEGRLEVMRALLTEDHARAAASRMDGGRRREP